MYMYFLFFRGVVVIVDRKNNNIQGLCHWFIDQKHFMNNGIDGQHHIDDHLFIRKFLIIIWIVNL